jgi:hypothetical protein
MKLVPTLIEIHTFKLTYENEDGVKRTKLIQCNTWINAIRRAYSATHKRSDERLLTIEFVPGRKNKDVEVAEDLYSLSKMICDTWPTEEMQHTSPFLKKTFQLDDTDRVREGTDDALWPKENPYLKRVKNG